MGEAARLPWNAQVLAGGTPRPARILACLAGTGAGLALAALAAGQGQWAWAASACLFAACWPLTWRRPGNGALHSLRVTGQRTPGIRETGENAGIHWEIGDAAGWVPVRLVRRWHAGAWITLEFLPLTAGDAAPQRGRRLTLWRGLLAPQAWRRLSALSAATLGRAAAGTEGAP